jgi:translation initiation factor 3 subunit C
VFTSLQLCFWKSQTPLNPLIKIKKKIISKHFQKCLEARERNPFNGPAENNRDIILASSKLLQQGNWKKCRDDILKLPIWQVMRNNGGVYSSLSREIQEQGLRTYLLTYGQYYVSLSLNDLCSLFELSEGDVRGIINKMIINEEFYASWDQLSDSVIVNCVEPSKLQSWALNYADKMNAFLESGESSEQRPVFERKWDNQQHQGSQGGRYGTKMKPGTPQYRTNAFVTRDKKGKTRPVGSRDDGGSSQFRQRKNY